MDLSCDPVSHALIDKTHHPSVFTVIAPPRIIIELSDMKLSRIGFHWVALTSTFTGGQRQLCYFHELCLWAFHAPFCFSISNDWFHWQAPASYQRPALYHFSGSTNQVDPSTNVGWFTTCQPLQSVSTTHDHCAATIHWIWDLSDWNELDWNWSIFCCWPVTDRFVLVSHSVVPSSR